MLHYRYPKCSQKSSTASKRRCDERREEAATRQNLSLAAKHRCDRQITRNSLLYTHMSPFSVLYSYGCDQYQITIICFGNRSGEYILHNFMPIYNLYSPYSSDKYIRFSILADNVEYEAWIPHSGYILPLHGIGLIGIPVGNSFLPPIQSPTLT